MNEEEKKAIEKFKFCGGYFVLDKESSKVVLNLIEKLQKENKYMHRELDKQQTKINKYAKENELAKQELIKNSNIADEKNQLLKENQQLKKQIKDKIEEMQKEYNKLDEQIEGYINDGNKDLSKYYENKEKIGEMQMLSYFIDNLQELMEESEES